MTIELKGYKKFGGVHSETAALHHVLAYQGVVSPVTGRPLSEALLFGVGLGVGASYFNFIYEGYPPTLSINMLGRYRARYGEVLQRTCERLGLAATLKTTKSSSAALKHIKNSLVAGQPVTLEVMQGSLSYSPTQPHENFAEQALVVYGLDETAGRLHVADRAPTPLMITVDELTNAWAIYAPLKHLSLTVAPGDIDLKGGIEAGMRSCVEQMLNPPTPTGNFGLNALRKWADLVADAKDERGWRQVFEPGPHLYSALAGVFAQIELVGAGGSGLRNFYADFLTEAGAILARPALSDVAALYRAAAGLWTNVAEAALPDFVPSFRETKELSRRKNQLFLAQGTAALEEMKAINGRQSEITAAMAETFPLDEAQRQELFSALREHILRLLAAEAEAIEALQATIS